MVLSWRILLSAQFFECPILNSTYEIPSKHWELNKDGQPTQKTIEEMVSGLKEDIDLLESELKLLRVPIETVEPI